MEVIRTPQFGESVFEASVGMWLKNEGEEVQAGEAVVELHTDKAVQEINALNQGVISRILKNVDEVVRPGDILCEIQQTITTDETEDTETSELESVEDTADATVAQEEAVAIDDAEELTTDVDLPDQEDSTPTDTDIIEIDLEPQPDIPSEEVAEETSEPVTDEESASEDEESDAPVIDISAHHGSEPTSEDETSDTELESDESDDAETSTQEEAEDEDSSDIAAISTETDDDQDADSEDETNLIDHQDEDTEAQVDSDDEDDVATLSTSSLEEVQDLMASRPRRREKLSRRRLTAARRLAQVQSETVMTTTFNEVDMHEVIRIRSKHRDNFESTHGIKLGFMSFFVKAAVSGLKAFPIVNSELQDDELVYNEYFDIGIAVASDKGLVVPVLRDADHMSFAEIERGIAEFAAKAKTGSFSLEDLAGGTFTITNGGVFGSMLSTPILNPPQVGILGMHNITERPIVKNGEIVAHPIMYVALTYDHRVVEGAQAVQFLRTIKESLESAEKLLLSI